MRPDLEPSVAFGRQTSLTAALWTSVAVGAAFTLVAALLDPPRLFATNPSLHVALDVAEGLISLLIAYLLIGRVRTQGSSTDAVAVFALALLAFNNLVVSALPTAAGGTTAETILAWAPYLIRVVAHAGMAVAAFWRPTGLRRPNNVITVVFVAVGVTLLLSGPASLILSSLVPSAQLIAGVTAGTFLDPSHDVTFAFQMISASLLAAASVGFAHKARIGGDDLYVWFSVGAVMGTFARLQYALFPGFSPDEVYLADLLRLGFYLLLLIGAQREIRNYWEARATASAFDERRRLARDLHDGLAQELIFIAGLSNRLERGSEDSRSAAPQLASAAERAVAEARRAISILTTEVSEPLSDALQAMVDGLRARGETKVTFIRDESVDLDPPHREEVLRMAREAVNNALKHAEARSIVVRLGRDEVPFVEVVDDGVGFDPAAPPKSAGGFGLLSMTERAHAIGARLEIFSSDGSGTTVRMELTSTTG